MGGPSVNIQRLAYSAAILLAVGAVAGACGGGGEALTLEEYFQRLDQIGDEADQKFQALDGGPGEEASDEEIADYIDSLTQQEIVIIADFIANLRDLDPPAEAEDVHAEAIESGEAAAQALQALADGIPDALSAAEAEAFFAEPDPDVEAAFRRFDDACFAFQAVADNNNIDVDLECEEE